MRVLVAPDKFKGTISAAGVAEAIAGGWRRSRPAAEIDTLPVADGGDGTLEALVEAVGGRTHRAEVTDPLGDTVVADYAIADTAQGRLGVVEMARASGLGLVSRSRRDPLRATTRGTGELILAACAHRPERLLVCIGGSATNDAGAGMAQALGIRLLDAGGQDLGPGGAALQGLDRVDVSGLDPSLKDVEVVVACDVDNPLVGPEGAAAVYGPQKGASPDDVALLDRALARAASVLERDLGVDLLSQEGAGAAGGLGGGLVAFLGGTLRPGFELVADLVGLRPRVEAADVVVTGEGRYDRQSERGKAAWGVLRMARDAARPTGLVAGQVEEGLRPPADAVEVLAERASVEECMRRPAELLEEAGAGLAAALGDL